MLRRCFTPYIVGGCIVALLFVSYVGYRVYQRHIEFEHFIVKAQAFSRSIEHHGTHSHSHAAGEHTHDENPPVSSMDMSSASSSFFKGKQGNQYVYEVDGFPIYSDESVDKEIVGLLGWISTGKLNPEAENYLKNVPDFKYKVTQRVVTPDGKVHNVLVPRFRMYAEGDAILPSEIRVARAIENGATIGETELETLPSEFIERLRRASPNMPPLSDKPPVKVSFLPDEGEGALPGWKRKGKSNRPSGSSEIESGRAPPVADSVSEGSINQDASSTSVGSGVPRSPSDLSRVVESTPSPPSIADIEKQLTPGGIEAELSQGLSPERFDKAQQLIDEYGTEEGLRRLRESYPAAARRLERERRGAPPP